MYRARAAAVLMLAVLTACGHQPAGKHESEAAARCDVAVDAHAADRTPTRLFSWRDPAVDESSGIALLPGGWLASVDDAGNPAVVSVADLDGARVTEVRVPRVRNEDWEDLATSRGADGRCHLWIADTGDAYRDREERGLPARTRFALVRLDLPVLGGESAPRTTKADGVASLPVVYPDGEGRNAEALLVHPREREMALVTRVEHREPGAVPAAEVWSVPKDAEAGEPARLRRIGTVPLPGVSGGAWSPDGSLVALRDATAAYVWHYDGDLATTLAAKPVDVSLPDQPQGEALAFTADGRGLLVSSEGAHTAVWRVPIPERGR